MQVEQEFFIGIQDVGINNEITNKAILEALTNVANVHGNLVKQGINNLEKNHITWVVLNWKLEVYKRPKACETILVKTWAQEYSKIQANRDYDIFNKNGEIIAKATSTWAAVNIESGKIVKLTDDIMGVYEYEENHKNFPDYEFTKIEEEGLSYVSKINFKINKSMIDCNNHVHNTSYVDLANEVLPPEIDKINYNNIEISYKKEIKPNEVVSITYYKENEKNYVFIKNDENDLLHSIIIFY